MRFESNKYVKDPMFNDAKKRSRVAKFLEEDRVPYQASELWGEEWYSLSMYIEPSP